LTISLQDVGEITIEDFITHVAPGIKGNLHDKAWDIADALIKKMRGQ
jgi:hypothetical protein